MKVLESIGTAAGAALGSSFGPLGTMLGKEVGQTLGGMGDDLLSKKTNSSNDSQGVHTCVQPETQGALKITNRSSDSQGVSASSQSPSALQDAGLRTNGSNVVDTGRYLITFKDGEVTVSDKLTNTSFRAWGDPHLETSDGDKAQFQENLTIDLEDGTKMTIKTTPKDANGVAYIDSVAVMKGDQAVVVNGLTGNDGFQMGNVLNNAAEVDAQMNDGTVLRAGHQADDLTTAANGQEILGTDPSQKWGEHLLDGLGGTSTNRAEPASQGTSTTNGTAGAGETTDTGSAGNAGDTSGTGSVSGPGNTSNLSLWDLLWQIIDKLGKLMENRAQGLLDKQKAMENYETQKADVEQKNKNLPAEQQAPLPKAPYSEAELTKEVADIQRFQGMITEFTTTMTNMQKTDHESKMAIAGNLK